MSGIHLVINEGENIALVGANGCGKSTLLAIISGQLEPDEGDFSYSKSLQMEVVEQFINEQLLNLTLLEALANKLPSEYQQYRAEQLLVQLGFVESEFPHKVSDLSGGQQNRLMFARAVITEPNLILFDEPTNHLDLKTLIYFESFLRNMKAAFLLISHDREFLDSVTQQTLVLRDQTLYHFDLPYSQAKIKLEEQDAAAALKLKAEEKNIKRLSDSAKRLAIWGKVYDNEDFAAKAKSMEKRIEKLKDQRTFVTRGSDLNLSLDVAQSRAKRVLQIEHHQVLSPANTPLFHIEDFIIRPGDRIALLGHNGAGKTTLINQLLLAHSDGQNHSAIKFNPQCDIGYYDQELRRLEPELDLMQVLRRHCPSCNEKQRQSALIKAGFPHKELSKKVAILSGGERARILFLIIKLNQPNFLILDEPTNHIDIQGKEELEQQILEARATTLITSHDRRFVKNIAQRFVVIQGGKLEEIYDPAVFYEQTNPAQTNAVQSSTVQPKQDNAAAMIELALADMSEDGLLVRILELEQLLDEDNRRKPKFQKPKKQTQWQAELDSLNQKLDSLS